MTITLVKTSIALINGGNPAEEFAAASVTFAVDALKSTGNRVTTVHLRMLVVIVDISTELMKMSMVLLFSLKRSSTSVK